MKTILCLDPGGKTGLAIIKYSEDSEAELSHFEEVPNGLAGMIDWHKTNKDTWSWDFIVCENFTLRTSVKFPDLSPVYIIGALEALESPREIIYQSPSQKHLCDDKRLKTLGLHKPGLGHANDAVRHGIIYLRNSRHMPTLRKGWSADEL
jgi:hypothetical protein